MNKRTIKQEDLKLLKILYADDLNKCSVIQKTASLEDLANNETLIFPFDTKVKFPWFMVRKYHYINNPDGSIRWMYPSDLKAPTFLNFYNSQGLKAKLMRFGIKTLWKFGLKKLISNGTFTIASKKMPKIESTFKNIDFENYSIFTGTVGPNRKILVELNRKRKTTRFVKVAISAKSLFLINNELNFSRKLYEMGLKKLVTPRSYSLPMPGIEVIENIKPKKIIQVSKILPVHIEALKELYEKSISFENLAFTKFGEDIVDQCSWLGSHNSKTPPSLIRKINKLKKQTDPLLSVPMSVSHGDFTPWNSYTDGKKVYAYDLELAIGKAPLFFDLFHFIFQSEILVHHNGFKGVNREIERISSHPEVLKLTKLHNIDFQEHLKLYLLYTISYYCCIYENQENLHQQAHWLMDAWEDALTFMLNKADKVPFREDFISDLFSKLSKVPHCALKTMNENVIKLPVSSDIDIAIQSKHADQFYQWIQKHPSISKVYRIKKSNMSIIEIYFQDGKYLSIDLINKFKRKSVKYMELEPMLKSAYSNKHGIRTPEERFDFEYILLFYHLNNSGIPIKYQRYYEYMLNSQREKVERYIRAKYQLDFKKLNELYEKSEKLSNSLQNYLKKQTSNKYLHRLDNVFKYVKDVLKDKLGRKGMIITISGVDGAGKTTIIYELQEKLKHNFRKKVVILRHRPSILPILSSYVHGKKNAEAKAASTLPRKGKNNSWMSSSLRFMYYYTDYLFGQFYVNVRYILPGYTVIYDRYYYDFITDPRRSNLVLNPKIAKFLFAFLKKPDLNVLLYASPKEILKRKKELNQEEITMLTVEYINLFNTYDDKYANSRYINIENTNKEITLNRIIAEYTKAA